MFSHPAEPVVITLKVDSIAYTNGTEVQLDEGPHTFDCIALNTELTATVNWDFNGDSVAPSDISMVSKGNMQDIDSTVIDHMVSGHDCGSSVRCSVVSSCSLGVQGFSNIEIILKVVSKYT